LRFAGSHQWSSTNGAMQTKSQRLEARPPTGHNQLRVPGARAEVKARLRPRVGAHLSLAELRSAAAPCGSGQAELRAPRADWRSCEAGSAWCERTEDGCDHEAGAAADRRGEDDVASATTEGGSETCGASRSVRPCAPIGRTQAEKSPAPDCDGQLGRAPQCAGLGDWFVVRDESVPRAHGGAGGCCGEVSPQNTLARPAQPTVRMRSFPVMAGMLSHRDRRRTRCAGLKTGALIAAVCCLNRAERGASCGEVAGKSAPETPMQAGDPQ
jgi:hypothetical protein